MSGRRTIGWRLAGIVLLLATSPALGQEPRYWVPRPPASYQPPAQSRWHPAQPPQAYYPAHIEEVTTQRYAYGWFGAKPRKHKYKHYGYYNRFTQWLWR